MRGNKSKGIKVFCIVGVIVALFTLMVFIKTRDLRELESVASKIQVKTGQLISRSSQNSGNVLGKPIYADLNLYYKPLNNYSKRDLYNEIISLLEKNNCKRDSINIVPDYYSGSMRGDTDSFALIRVGVYIYPDINLVGIRYTHR